MKLRLIYLLAAIMLCTSLQAKTGTDIDSPAMQVLKSQKNSRILSGTKLKIARPFIKKTPMGVILDDITTLVICNLENPSGSHADMLPQDAREMLKGYMPVREIDDERSRMSIYINEPQGNRFTEIVIYNSRPDASMMLFVGEFTEESLRKVGEASEEERKHLKKNN